ncbi:MAG: hypothetical protein HC802_10815 [Caldilineaceae bacterium]|nr:hypothetical protein [Caldilineaceae bacterium]
MTEQPLDPRTESPNSIGQPLLIGCGSALLATFLLLVGLGIGFLVGQWSASDRATASTLSFLPTVDSSDEPNAQDAERFALSRL